MREVFASKCREFGRVCNSVRVTVALRVTRGTGLTSTFQTKLSSLDTLKRRRTPLSIDSSTLMVTDIIWLRTRWPQIERNLRWRNPRPSMWKFPLLKVNKQVFYDHELVSYQSRGPASKWLFKYIGWVQKSYPIYYSKFKQLVFLLKIK